MTPDPISILCAIVRGEPADLPTAERAGFFELARRHRVHLLVAWRLQKDPRWLEDGRSDAPVLVAEMRAEGLVDELKVRELARVIAALEDRGTMPVVFKGAALAHTHYAESWLRPRLDADILILPERRQEAFECLGHLGYTRPAFISGDLVMHQAPFVRTDSVGIEHVLDVHWRIANPHVIAIVLSHEEIASRARTIDVRGHRIRVPSPVDALLLACVHRAAHHDDSEELLWLFDVHLLAERFESLEWDQFVALASQRAVRAICARGLSLSTGRFNTRVPSKAIAELALETVAGEPSSVYLKKNLRQVDRLASDLRALGPWAGARLVREHLFPPAGYMREKYAFKSSVLLPAFYALRIFSGVSKWMRPPGRKLPF